MNNQQWLAERFEEHRGHLRAVAYRMLGSAGEADDAVQETWLRLSRSSAESIENLGGWLTTVAARVCLDLLRSRKSHAEEPLPPEPADAFAALGKSADPEQEALLADSVGLALLVVLDRLTAPERLAFVLHDMFDVSFDEIARILGRSPEAVRQLASRARRRVRHPDNLPADQLHQQRTVVDSFLTALRAGDFQGLLAVLDPDVVVRIDQTAARPGAAREIRGAENWAKGAIAFSSMSRFIQPALIDGAVGVVLAPRGRLLRALRCTIVGGKIVEVEIVGDREHLRQLYLAVLE